VSVGIDSSVGRRKLDFMTENPAGVGIGASNRQSANRVESGSNSIVEAPSASAQYISLT